MHSTCESLNCDHASVCCGYSCRFKSYTPPYQQTDYFYPCDFEGGMELVSSCPELYTSWKLSNDCEESPEFLVYSSFYVYRNSYCAICNLGDFIADADINPPPIPSSLKLAQYIPELTQSDTEYIIRMSYQLKHCCGRCPGESNEYCTPLTQLHLQWGQIWDVMKNTCFLAPFNTTCNNDTLSTQPYYDSWDVKLQFLCPNVNFACTNISDPDQYNYSYIEDEYGDRQDGQDGQPGSASVPGGVAAGIFGNDVAKMNSGIEHHERIDTMLTFSNQYFQLCSNGVITISPDGGEALKIVLSNGEIQV